MCTFVCRLVNPFNCNKLNGQLVNLYIVYICKGLVFLLPMMGDQLTGR